MDSKEFRQRGREMVDYIADYIDTINTRRVTPNIEPGYLKDLLPSEAPQKGESWNDIMQDVETKIMPGVTHWQHPHFHAYFPSGNSFPSILGDMLSDGFGSIGFSWAASPACTELETIVLDWMGKMVGLPSEFLSFSENSKGGGVIQGSASECVFVTLLAARAHKIRELKKQHPFVEEGVLMSKLMAYCSKEAHSCVEKSAMMAFVKLRILQPDENQSLRGNTLQQAMEDDIAMGLIPFYVETTLGTTSCCSFDNLSEIGPICAEYGAWLHVDGAYAGNSFICPELRKPMKGIEYASSFNFNPNKFMLTNFDCSVMWVQDRFRFTQALVVDPLYLQHSYSEKSIDYRHWGIPLSRRFRALKLWFVIRSFGIEGLQNYIREHCRLAIYFESMVKKDERFEVASPVHLGLVCFRLKGKNDINARLLSSINADGKLHMVPASLGDKYVIRFCVCAQNATDSDIEYAWNVICEYATHLLQLDSDKTAGKPCRLSETSETMPVLPEEGEPEEGYESGGDPAEEVFQFDRKNQLSLKSKRSFFVRMVSDPKIYNPSVVRSLSSPHQGRHRTTSTDDVQSPNFWCQDKFNFRRFSASDKDLGIKSSSIETEDNSKLTLYNITSGESDLDSRSSSRLQSQESEPEEFCNRYSSETANFSRECYKNGETSPECYQNGKMYSKCYEYGKMSPECYEDGKASPECYQNGKTYSECYENGKASLECYQNGETSSEETSSNSFQNGYHEELTINGFTNETKQYDYPNGIDFSLLSISEKKQNECNKSIKKLILADVPRKHKAPKDKNK